MGVTFEKGKQEGHMRWRVRPTEGFAPFDVVLSPGALTDGAEAPAGLFDERDARGERRRLIVIDKRVAKRHRAGVERLYRQGGAFELFEIEVSERIKNVETVLSIIAEVRRLRLGRDDVLVAIGGGVMADVVGAAASMLHKGMRYEVGATTLTAIGDAGYAGKRRVNLEGEKNVVGGIWTPRYVLGDVTTMKTLDPRHVRSGLAEAHKVAVMRDGRLLRLLEEDGPDLIKERFCGETPSAELLQRMIDAPLRRIAADPRDSERERWLDSHHLLAHPIERETAGEVSHGEAVAICGAVMAHVALKRDCIREPMFKRIVGVLRELGLPVTHELATEPRFVIGALQSAVQQRGAQNIPVPSEVGGNAFLHDVDATEIMLAARVLADPDAA
ncbi:3-dehydroquinate synthase family protein [Conexibacter woesei]|uniref:3-dehydroquinate synthase n=1 Tax=Conexibacter woesei (strain DSM 14684 / CCUG 47730 / CIP 108061 / JCM 11494 / NBRC 100937 / ID131577) TaxID=469383 RepID=D3EZ19_CONWI|nr:3-dehydroquinate synthase [Conexibacter woesei]ADB49893.1 3-dehydroquinate synthase [Conexibacter woesei DSM 14684]